MIQNLADVALAIAALGCVVFVVVYALLADWRATPVGRNVMAFMACCAVLLGIGVLRAFVEIGPLVTQWVRLAGFVSVAYIVWRRVYLLIKAQLSERTTDGHDDRSAERCQDQGPAGRGHS